MKRTATAVVLVCLAILANAQVKTEKDGHSQQTRKEAVQSQRFNLTQPPGTLFVVPYAHLDTEWRWEYPQVIREYLANTLHDNFRLIDKYPHYVFNFSGANRYEMFKEYYPAEYAKLKQYVAAGRWFPAGSSMEESDVNTPSAESIFRQVLYGNEFFRREFGKASAEYMLPDCFGFPASLPSILAHAGVKGFSTQKLTWHSAVNAGGPDSPEKTPGGVPFNFGWWAGPDGRGLIAALNPGAYDQNVYYDLTKSQPPEEVAKDERALKAFIDWPSRVKRNGDVSGLYSDYMYYGTGDIGGPPLEDSVRMMEAIVTGGTTALPSPREAYASGPYPVPMNGPIKMGDGPLHVTQGTAEDFFLNITPEQAAKLPKYSGDMELIEHSAGSLTSQAFHKHMNRRNEVLADDAERASVAAMWLGARQYPLQRLNRAWRLVMGGQFHDIQAGTATPRSYEFSWNDDLLAQNQFASVLTSAVEGVVSGLDTRTKGTAIVVYNPLNIAREDVVEATAVFPEGAPKGVEVTGPDDVKVPAQIDDNGKLLFVAKVPPIGYAVYDVEPADFPMHPNQLSADSSKLENARYRVSLNADGDVSSIFDKKLNRELLKEPLRLAFMHEAPHDWPAWNMDWSDQQKPPYGYVHGPAQVRVVENGPARVAVEVARETDGSKFVQTIRLSAGDAGNRVEFLNAIDWRGKATALKATVVSTASNPKATYNWDIGTVVRENNAPKKYEVASHQWFDLTDKSGDFGVTVLSNDKYGSDKPSDDTVRLTLIYTPGIGDGNGRDYSDQTSQDWGHHAILYGLTSHAGDWRSEGVDWQGYRLNQPLLAFTSEKHAGALGKSFSLLKVSNDRIRVLALKKAENTDEIVVRAVEMSGKPQPKVEFRFPATIASMRGLNGQEMPLKLSAANIAALVADFSPYEVKTFAVKLAAPKAKLTIVNSVPLKLIYDVSTATQTGKPAVDKSFDAQGRTLPAEMLPSHLEFENVAFNLVANGPNAVAAKGQKIALPAGKFNRVYILATSTDDDQDATFQVGSNSVKETVPNWTGFIGQWDVRQFTSREETYTPNRPNAQPRTVTIEDFKSLTPAFVKRAPVAWFASHHHTAEGKDEPYAYSYLYAYAIDLPQGATSITLPDNPKVLVFAVSAANVSGSATPAAPLYDTLQRPTAGASVAQK